MYDIKLLEKIKKTENELTFSEFNQEDAYSLGNIILQTGKKYPKPIAFRIVLNGYIVYQYLMEGTTDFHIWWMDRKQRVVERTHNSSLYMAVIKEHFPNKKWYEDEKKYAFCGGAFPIKVNGEYKGMAIVSGLTDIEDNEIVTQAIKRFLEENPQKKSKNK